MGTADRRRPSPRLALVAVAVLLVAGCASSQIVNEWVNPEQTAGGVRRVLVFGVSRQTSIRRTFEDRFVARLGAEGVEAVPSYRYLPQDGPVPEAQLREAIKQAGADGAIITRLLGVERRTQVSPGVYHPPPPAPGLFPWYTGAWTGYYDPPQVLQYDVYTSETTLYDTRRDALVWVGTVQTTESGNITRQIEHYVDVVVKRLKREGILPA